MRTAVITPRLPGSRSDAFAQRVREGGIDDWRCRDPGAASADAVAAGGSGKVPRTSASADAVGSPFGSQVADRLCSAV